MAALLTPLGGAVRSARTDRHGGVSTGVYASLDLAGHVGDDPDAVVRNRSILADDLGTTADRLVAMEQVHGADVVTVEVPMRPPVADALVTAVPDLWLTVLAADCVPLVLADPAAGLVGVAHAGWRGFAAGVVGATVERMVALGASPTTLRGLVGPAICGRCYEVGPEVVDAVALLAPAAVTTTRTGTPAVDLVRGVVDVLTAAGVAVEVDGRCTFEDTGLYSFRRDGVTGRHAAVVGLVPA